MIVFGTGFPAGHTAASGTHRSPTYNSWRAMRERCTRESHPYYDTYGGRGIRVSDLWQSFAQFLADMGERPPGTTLDRIDPNGHYTPQNCRWATPAVQVWNRRNILELAEHDPSEDESPLAADTRDEWGF
jgi:hypothetical protein